MITLSSIKSQLLAAVACKNDLIVQNRDLTNRINLLERIAEHYKETKKELRRRCEINIDNIKTLQEEAQSLSRALDNSRAEAFQLSATLRVLTIISIVSLVVNAALVVGIVVEGL